MEKEICQPKVDVLTIHFGVNHGSVLQCYALTRTLNSIGADSEVIDYVPSRYRMWENVKIKFSDKPLPWKLAMFCASSVVRLPQKCIFRWYLKRHLHLSRRYSTLESLALSPPKANLYIVGSDQVWNSAYNGIADDAYYLPFLPKDAKRASYAASIGRDSVSDEEALRFKETLPFFEGVSVRESAGAKILGDLGIACRHDLDPVFLLGKDEWARLASKKGLGERYVLVYVIAQNYDEMLRQAREIADGLGAKLFVLSVRPIFGYRIDRNYVFSNPSDFLGLFSRAQFVISNSFHGTAFSIIFHKQFLTYATRYNSRIESILALTKLESRLVFSRYTESQIEAGCCWDYSDNVIGDYRKSSVEYLSGLVEGCCS